MDKDDCMYHIVLQKEDVKILLKASEYLKKYEDALIRISHSDASNSLVTERFLEITDQLYQAYFEDGGE